MKIKQNRRREWGRLLAKIVGVGMLGAVCVFCIKAERTEGNELAPKYQDGDLVLVTRWNDEPFLQLRVRGFDD